MKSKKGQLLWRKIVPLEIAAGVLLLSGVFLLSSSLDITRTEKRLYHTVEYIKEQCNNSELRDLASEAKSLLRVTQSAEQVQWRLQGGRDDMTSREHAEKTLEDYAKASYLDGLFLLDADGNVLAQYDKAGLTAGELLAQTDTDALMDVVDFREKSYGARIPFEDGSHVDLAAVGRRDAKGVIVGYFYTPAEYTRIFNSSLNSLVSGYEPEQDGTIVISSGSKIVASNNKSLVGADTGDFLLLKRIMERGTGGKLVHADGSSSKIRHEFGLMDRSTAGAAGATLSVR